MKKYKINNKIVKAKSVLDAIAKVKDTKYIIQHKHNSNSTVGEDGLFHFGGIKYAKRFDTISEAINHANSMSSNWEKLYDIVEIKDSVIRDMDYNELKELVKDIETYDRIRISKYSSNGEITMDLNQLFSKDVNSLYRAIKNRGYNCEIINDKTVKIKDSVSDSYIYADLGQDYKKNADDIRKMGLKVSFMGRSDGYGMYGKIEGTRQQLERLQERGYFENEIIKDSISQEYEEIRKQIGEKKYNAIQEYLKTHKNFLLSDIYYNQDAWNKFETWYNNGMKDSVKDANVNILNNLIAEEEKAINDYKSAIENDTDEQAISLYKHILNEEIEHLEELKTLLNGRTEDFVKDMSMKRIDAIDRCYSLGKKFIEHFDKIYKNPTSLDTNHHCNEMQSWYNQVRDITLKEDKKPLSKDCLIDWFFTATGNPDNFMSNPSREELNAYNDFTYNVLLNNDVKTSINKIIKEK